MAVLHCSHRRQPLLHRREAVSSGDQTPAQIARAGAVTPRAAAAQNAHVHAFSGNAGLRLAAPPARGGLYEILLSSVLSL